MRKLGGHRIVIALACSLLSAAASFQGCLSFGDLQGSDGGTTDASSADAPIDSGTDAAITDAAIPETYVPFDGASGMTFCATQIDAAFCDDFDQTDAAPLAKWQPPNVSVGASLTMTTAALSAPNAVLAEVRANPAGSLDLAANVSHLLPGTIHTVRYTYDLLVDTYDASGSTAYVGAMDERVGLADVEVRLNLEQAGLEVEGVTSEGDGGVLYQPFGSKVTVVTGTWHHIEIDADYTQNPAQVSFSYDGATIFQNTPLTAGTLGAGAVTVQAGFLYALTPTSGWKIRVDDVAVFTE